MRGRVKMFWPWMKGVGVKLVQISWGGVKICHFFVALVMLYLFIFNLIAFLNDYALCFCKSCYIKYQQQYDLFSRKNTWKVGHPANFFCYQGGWRVPTLGWEPELWMGGKRFVSHSEIFGAPHAIISEHSLKELGGSQAYQFNFGTGPNLLALRDYGFSIHLW